jgi:stearoyl-CoA desaturase (delta-9 desaturase)
VLQTILLAVAVGVALTTVANLCTTVYLHRGIAHRAITFSAPTHAVFKTLIWLTVGIKVREWVAVHRKHHAHTDTPLDPHSPAVHGWFKVQRKNLQMYRSAAHDRGNLDKYAKDLPRTRWDRLLYDQSWLGLTILTAALCLMLGWQVGALAMVVHVNYYLGGSAAVNAIGHHFGRRPYANSATNLQWLALLTAGEGLHNNHHAAPTSAKLAHRWYEFDPGWMLIKPLTWMRLAKVRLGELKFAATATVREAATNAKDNAVEAAKSAAAAAKDAAAAKHTINAG